jgi:CHASE2 domain-containing sensor protein/serine/threonine protein kinase
METTLAGRYQIVRQLGGGGFGQTFLAKDTHLPGSPFCVVKQLKPAMSDQRTLEIARRLFEREAEMLYRLGNHDQIPHLLAHFQQEHEFYLVQDYIEGQPLNEELSPGRQCSAAAVMSLLWDILQVLSFVHQQRVIHRDIKPANLIRRRQDGKIVLIDFGAVKEVRVQAAGEGGQTNLTVAIGSPGYMPVEQQSFNPHFSSDLYAVGMVCMQALTGLPPKELPRNEQGEFSCALFHNCASVDPKLATILERMTRYDYRQRYTNASEALAELQELCIAPGSTILSPTPVPNPPSTPSSTILSPSLPVPSSSSALVENSEEPAPLHSVVHTDRPLDAPESGNAKLTWGHHLRSLGKIFLCSVLTSVVVMGVRFLGGLQFLELKALDTFMQLRPADGQDDRILLVTFTEADVQALKQASIADRTLVKLLTKLEKYQPAVIGLDLYRDIPIGEGRQELLTYLQQSNLVVATCKAADDTDKMGIAPPDGIAGGSVSQDSVLGFSNVVLDTDNSVRRHYLQLNPPAAARCATHYALSLQVAFRYLQQMRGIQGQFLNATQLQLGNVVFNRLQVPAGGYQQVDDGGFQILLNYRSPLEVAERVTVSDVLAGRVQHQNIKDKIVLVGVDREDMDRVLTPYGKDIPGVSIQAQGASQIVSAVLDGRSVLTVWSPWVEVAWILVWSLIGGLVIWRFRRTCLPGIAGSTIILSGSSFWLLIEGIWVPLIPPILAILLTTAFVSAYSFFDLEKNRTNT